MGSLEEESLVNGSSNSPVTLLVSAPVSSIGGWSPHLRDLHILSFSFLFVFLAYGALQNLESSIHGVGSSHATLVSLVKIERFLIKDIAS